MPCLLSGSILFVGWSIRGGRDAMDVDGTVDCEHGWPVVFGSFFIPVVCICIYPPAWVLRWAVWPVV